ncbi:hypothetical protein M8818_001816 [Zalaria obscura]|uniref:Uncharacterized protein n=1 Tax=Zalaria obscura TaxID=2024903 RepID=A0ACC3SJZ2_9PEZI
MDELVRDYPWTQAPLIAGAPMRLIAMAPLAVEVSRAGGLGFIGIGTDPTLLTPQLSHATRLLSANPIPSTPASILPIGLGFLLHTHPLEPLLSALRTPPHPAAIWLFAPTSPAQLAEWTVAIRAATDAKTKIWIQVGSVAEAVEVVQQCEPDVLVVQGQDAGGHGLAQAAGLITLLPEVADALAAVAARDTNSPEKQKARPHLVAAGGITEPRSLASALALGASGAAMGTRLLATAEADIARGYQDAVLRASDGGASTVRSRVYDALRGTTGWPAQYGGRGIINASFRDWEKGVPEEENRKAYEESVKLGDKGWEGEAARLTAYAGTGVGLVREVLGAGRVVRGVREEGLRCLVGAARRFARL